MNDQRADGKDFHQGLNQGPWNDIIDLNTIFACGTFIICL